MNFEVNDNNNQKFIIIGGGPAGLTAGYELQRFGKTATILEMASCVGGIARTETYRGFRFDIGGHRFFTTNHEVEKIWHEILGHDLLTVQRLSRIYYEGKFYDYPLDLANTLQNLGAVDSLKIMISYLKWKLFPYPEEETFEQWTTNRFGRQLYERFFRTYTEKVWGIPTTMIRADWAAQRIKDLSLKTVVTNALGWNSNTRSLIERFYYPRLGPGMMWERLQSILEESGSTVKLNTEVVALKHEDHRIKSVVVSHNNTVTEIPGDEFIASMPISALIKRLEPQAPEFVLEAAHSLRYRDFLIVILIVEQTEVFPDNWIYVHSPELRVGRIQNFKNWSAAMVPDDGFTALGMEYFCSEGDELWEKDEHGLIALASVEISMMGFVDFHSICDGTVIRQRKAYPVYDQDYSQHLKVIQSYLGEFENLQTVGRNGMHRYNNQDHSMLTGMFAVRNIFGERNDLWEVNLERSYQEEFVVDNQQATAISSLRQSIQPGTPD